MEFSCFKSLLIWMKSGVSIGLKPNFPHSSPVVGALSVYWLQYRISTWPILVSIPFSELPVPLPIPLYAAPTWGISCVWSTRHHVRSCPARPSDGTSAPSGHTETEQLPSDSPGHPGSPPEWLLARLRISGVGCTTLTKRLSRVPCPFPLVS